MQAMLKIFLIFYNYMHLFATLSSRSHTSTYFSSEHGKSVHNTYIAFTGTSVSDALNHQHSQLVLYASISDHITLQ